MSFLPQKKKNVFLFGHTKFIKLEFFFSRKGFCIGSLEVGSFILSHSRCIQEVGSFSQYMHSGKQEKKT